jgi:hypothetical protein
MNSSTAVLGSVLASFFIDLCIMNAMVNAKKGVASTV